MISLDCGFREIELVYNTNENIAKQNMTNDIIITCDPEHVDVFLLDCEIIVVNYIYCQNYKL
jgi:predicted glycoside hydrolase/deacetylase ChbG (UPF0249 family)